MSNTELKAASQDDYWTIARSYVDEVTQINIEQGQATDSTLDSALESCIHAITYRYANTTLPMADIEPALHNAWYVCIQAAKHMYCSNHKQDALVRTILGAKVMGHLRRPQATPGDDDGSEGDGELVCFSDGSKFWVDLPFFGADLVDEWANHYYLTEHYDEAQRSYLAAFVGRLISVGIYDGPATCLLSLLRETLETRRPLVSAATAEDKGENNGTETILPIDDLLGALQQLFHHTERGTFMLRYYYSPKDSQTGAGAGIAQLSSLGELAVQSGAIVSDGYSPERWTFWINRLKELAGCDVKSVAGNAEACLLYMHGEVDGKVGSYIPLADS